MKKYTEPEIIVEAFVGEDILVSESKLVRGDSETEIIFESAFNWLG